MVNAMTITLAGSETEAAFSGANAWLRNDGAGTIHAAKTAGVTAGADGVVAVPAGQSAPVYGANGRVFLTGTGSVQLIGSDYSTNPFKTSAQAGGSGADEVARAAVTAHAGNGEIHVTAAQKGAWDAKAELSDIPTSLPANGGNADTVGGLHAADLFQKSEGLRSGNFYSDIFSTTLTYDHPCWNKHCFVTGVSNDAQSESYIENAPETSNALWYEVFTCGNTAGANRAYQLAIGCYSHQRKAFIRYCHDSWWSDWKNIADGGNAASVGAYTEAKIAALEARIAALEGGT